MAIWAIVDFQKFKNVKLIVECSMHWIVFSVHNVMFRLVCDLRTYLTDTNDTAQEKSKT